MVDILVRNNVTILGRGTRHIIFAHGFGCNKQVWRYIQDEFENDYQLILFDFVGSGKSNLKAYDPVKYNSLSGYVQDVIDIIETLNLMDVVVIGHSVASMIALKAAVKYPHYFSLLIFIAPSPCYFNDEDYKGGLEKTDINALLEMMDYNYLGWSSYLAPKVMANPQRPDLSEDLEANFCATDPVIARQFAKVTFLSDNRSELSQLTIKSLTIQCVEDVLAPVEVGYYMQKNIPGNVLTILDARGHCPHLSAPKETVFAIKKFINKNDQLNGETQKSKQR